MPYTLQTTRFVDAARRAYSVRGALEPFEADTVVIPTASAVNLDGPPWRSDGVRVTAGIRTSAVAGQFARAELLNATSIFGRELLVLDEIYIGAGSTTAVVLGLKLGVLAVTQPMQATEFPPRGPNLTDILSPAPFGWGAVNSSTSAIGTQIGVVTAGSQPLVLRFGDGLVLQPTLALALETSSQNVDLILTASGRWWRSVG